jgi:two-component system OmpR family sensor kinase
MGARSLELTLRGRLLAVLVPALGGVALATVAIVWLALARADEQAARDRAHAALHLLASELAEGDAVQVALDEVVRGAETAGVRVWLRRGAVSAKGASPPVHPGEGACRGFEADDGRWCGCAVRDGEAEAVVAVSTAAHDGVVRAVGVSTALVALVALALAVLASRASLRAPLASVDALVTWAERLVRVEEPAPAPLPAPASDASAEIARLAAAFDALVRRLFETLERERARSAFIAHELRTPLTAMRAELEALAAREPSARELVGDIDGLSRAIEAILALAQPRTGEAEGEVVNVADLARELSPQAAVIEAPDEALVRGDEALLALALRNMLENADKHGGGATHVAVRRDGDGIELVVRDEGGGLDAQACARAFERHWRASSSASGSGLGLALVEAVATRHGGAADARPNPGGKGLEVRVRLGAVVGWHD